MPSKQDEDGAVEATCARLEQKLRPLLGHLDTIIHPPSDSCCIDRWPIGCVETS